VRVQRPRHMPVHRFVGEIFLRNLIVSTLGYNTSLSWVLRMLYAGALSIAKVGFSLWGWVVVVWFLNSWVWSTDSTLWILGIVGLSWGFMILANLLCLWVCLGPFIFCSVRWLLLGIQFLLFWICISRVWGTDCVFPICLGCDACISNAFSCGVLSSSFSLF
jgi:hypothetical protein